MSKFRAVILDYPKLQLDNPDVKRLLADIIVAKQLNFQRTKEMFVALDKNDIIGSHLLIYDTTKMYDPKLILAIRNSYEERTRNYDNVQLPYTSYIHATGELGQKDLESFRKTIGLLVNCDMWFVDPDYGYSKTKLPLSEVGFLLACLQIRRLGYDHLIGCTNEKYKASRWLSPIGPLSRDRLFDHPVLPGKHKMIYLEHFDDEWLKACIAKHISFLDDLWDLSPKNLGLPSVEQTIQQIKTGYTSKAS